MHPNDISGSFDTAFTQPIPVSHQPTQHGFPAPNPNQTPSLRGAGGVIDSGCATLLNTTEEVGTPPSDGRGESPSKKDAIRKYEAKWTSPTRDTAFRVKKTDWDGRKDSPISRFPNEVLIHALSFLNPQTLLNVAFISRRFHSLVTSSHAWRSAFSRYFPSSTANPRSLDGHESAAFSSSQDRRYFMRLSESDDNDNLWRKEYILRTRLLRNLARGKANISTNLTTGAGQNPHGSVVIMYSAFTGSWSVSHITANFTPKGVRLLHASVHSPGVVTASDPTIGRVERPPPVEPFMRIQQRPDLQQPLLGLRGFEVATDMGTSGVMDLSRDIGWIYGENVPGGKVYVHPHASPYVVAAPPGFYIRPDHESIDGFRPVVTSVWIAKKRWTGVLETTEGRMGILVGTSRGIVSTYGLSFGKENILTSQRKFCLSPGVPIVSIKVDDEYSVKRMRQNNVWIVAINALGEVYYLRNSLDSWKIISQTSRTPTALYNSTFTSPAENFTEVEKTIWEKSRDERLMKMDYEQIKDLWGSWGMDWFVEVDWVDQNVVVGKKQSIERRPQSRDDTAKTDLYRYHLVLSPQSANDHNESVRELVGNPSEESTAGSMESSVFGGVVTDLIRDMSAIPQGDIWIATLFRLDDGNMHIITATAMDNSNLALLSDHEDPSTKADTPGGNARLLAVGTHMGSVFVWNIRSFSTTANAAFQSPSRVIHTDSPQISSLALSSLYLVHGGTDGLVQAWDPLASTLLPIRNIHSKFSSRVRHQADAGFQEEFGVADNQFAARSLTLDPDPTCLRGAVALGTLIRYWCFSSDPDKKKRKPGPRSSTRGAPLKGRGIIKAAIQSETRYHHNQKEQEYKEKEEFKSRYGVTSGREALSEKEMVEYATMISRETFELESGGSVAGWEESNTSRTIMPDGAPSVSSYCTADEYKSSAEGVNDEEDLELAEALKLSLLGVGGDDSGKPHQTREVWEDADYLYSDFGSKLYNSPPGYVVASSSSSSSKPKSSSPGKSYSSPYSLVKSGGWERLPLGEIDEWPDVGGKGKGKVESSDRAEEEFEMELKMAIRLSLMEEEDREGAMEALGEDGRGKGKRKT